MANFSSTFYVDNTTNLNATDLNAPIKDMDYAMGKNAGHHAFITSSGPVSVQPIDDGDVVSYPQMYVWHHRKTDGAIIMNTIAAASHTITNSTTNVNANVVYATLSETDGAAVTSVTLSANSQGTGDYDLVPTLFADYTKIVICIRTRMPSTSQRGLVFWPMLAYHQPLRGTDALGAGTTSKVVTFPSSISITGTDYQVILSPRSAGFWVLDPYISARTTTTFTITHTSSASQNFDWQVVT